ncbi:RNA-DNA hybrid ribonuclease [Geranomyces variabilis]|uniref:RNA-DNA hybrid ribonuclease n=1 Tax=Geranomyces variabilis TaxID=109894 RepID=A0AAD5XRQ6_9FUNG|nr:RNA-DNA hybrid ribonuclease [Geranomyces variabilis]
MAGKKGGGKKAGGKKQKEADAAAATLLKITQLKELKGSYASNCKFFVAEPQAPLVKRIETELKNADGPEDIDKIILGSLSLAPNDIYSMTTTFDRYSALSGLYLWKTKTDLKGLEALASFLCTHPTVASLHLMDCQITPVAARHVQTICKTSVGLRALVVDHNPLGTEGLSAIFAGIQENPASVIQKASFRYCEAGSTAADAVGAALASNATLTELQLDGNFLGDAGIGLLARYLRSNTTLKSLFIAANQISNVFPSAAPPIPTPYLTGRTEPIPPSSRPPLPNAQTPLAQFCAALASENGSLTFLDLRGNHIGNTGAEHVLEMLKSRKALLGGKQAEGMMVYVTERMSEDLFEKIWELNDAMAGSGAKKGKGGKKGKKK